ncbi:MAG: hypothetical protein K0U29_03445 [Gammaproteobacteria bacterium]|nr:hypothetical protein [Gammaproteobacteria bacterium]
MKPDEIGKWGKNVAKFASSDDAETMLEPTAVVVSNLSQHHAICEASKEKASVKETAELRLFKKALDSKKVAQFLLYVSQGDQHQAETMLKKDPVLALGKGDCKDFADREFKGITGFQYALWALDWHMWEMIVGYLEEMDPDAAREQCREQEAVTQALGYGNHYDLEELIGALKNYSSQYIALSSDKKWDAVNSLWVYSVGGAQKKMVAHVAQEYCHPDRPLEPIPDFSQKPFKRQFKTYDDGDWRTDVYNDGPLGGKSQLSSFSGFAFCRGPAKTPICYVPIEGGESRELVTALECLMAIVPMADKRALSKLHKVRMSQLTEVRQRLSVAPSPPHP